MNKEMQSTVLSVIGVIAVVAAIGGLYLNFVKPVMQWPIILAAAVLIAVALRALMGREKSGRHGEAEAIAPFESTLVEGGHDHDHGRGPRVGWLLLVPFLLLGVVTPGPLAAFSAERDSGRVMIGSSQDFDPLAPTDGGAVLPLGEYSMRALYDDPANLEDTSFTLMGFASRLPDGEGWALTRMSLNCCAGDAQAIKVRVLGAPAPADDEWVEVAGTWRKSPTPVEDPSTLPIIEATALTPVNAPKNVYE